MMGLLFMNFHLEKDTLINFALALKGLYGIQILSL